MLVSLWGWLLIRAAVVHRTQDRVSAYFLPVVNYAMIDPW